MENKNKIFGWIFLFIILVLFSTALIFNIDGNFSMDKLRIYGE